MYIVLSSDLARFCIFQTFCHLINQLITLARPRGAFAPKNIYQYQVSLLGKQAGWYVYMQVGKYVLAMKVGKYLLAMQVGV